MTQEVEVIDADWRIADSAGGRVPARSGRAPAPRRIPLRTLDHVANELRKLYRDTRCGLVPSSDASRMAFVLDRLSKVLELTELERRICALESQEGNHP